MISLSKTYFSIILLCLLVRLTNESLSDLCKDFNKFEKNYSALFKSNPKDSFTDLRAFLNKQSGRSKFTMPWVTDKKSTVVMVRPFKVFTSKVNFELTNEIEYLKKLGKSEQILNFVDCFMSISDLQNEFNPILDEDLKLGVPTVYLIYENYVGTFAKSTNLKSSNSKSPFDTLKAMPFKNRLQVYRTIAQSIAYLHSKNMVYGNLEESTIVAMNNQLSKIKLYDFEFATENNVAIPFKNNMYLVSTMRSDVEAFGYMLAHFEEIQISRIDGEFEITKKDFGIRQRSKSGVANRSAGKIESSTQKLFDLIEKCMDKEGQSSFPITSVIKELDSMIANALSSNLGGIKLSFNYNSKKVVHENGKKIQRITDITPNPDHEGTAALARNFRGYQRKVPKYYNLVVIQEDERLKRKLAVRQVDPAEETKISADQEARLQAEFDEEAKKVRLSGFFSSGNEKPKQIGRVVLGGESIETETTSWSFSVYISLFGVLLVGLIAVPVYFVCKKRQY